MLLGCTLSVSLALNWRVQCWNISRTPTLHTFTSPLSMCVRPLTQLQGVDLAYDICKLCHFLMMKINSVPHDMQEGKVDRVSKLKNDSMRINSNAMFFGRASLGMKKATTSVAVATLLFDFRIW